MNKNSGKTRQPKLTPDDSKVGTEDTPRRVGRIIVLDELMNGHGQERKTADAAPVDPVHRRKGRVIALDRHPVHSEPAEERLPLVAAQPHSVFAECLRFIRSRIVRPLTGEPPRTILVTSAMPGDGKTLVSTNLAVSISQGPEEHALLIDSDLRNPSVHKLFGLPAPRDGLCTFLSADKPIEELLLRTSIPKFAFLPAGLCSGSPAELLSSFKMQELIEQLRNRYPDRFVIIDSPPLELAPEASVIANAVDTVIIVARHEKTPRHSLKNALKRLPRHKIMGIVYNCYNKQSAGYYPYRNSIVESP